jgi:hypothetical protein
LSQLKPQGSAYQLEIVNFLQLFLNLQIVPGVIQTLSSLDMAFLAGVTNAEHPLWNRTISNPSGEKLLELFDINYFQTSVPHTKVMT